MDRENLQSVLITGANAGIGKEVARQLAQRTDIKSIYLACRNLRKAQIAKQELEKATGRNVFSLVTVDLSNQDSVHAALNGLPPIDGLVMNAGGMGGRTPLQASEDGVSELFAQNLLGHVVLLEELLRSKRLNKVAVLVGSEAARGVAMMGAQRPAFKGASPSDLEQVITGAEPKARKLNAMSAYGEVKLLGALWMSALARTNPTLRLITVSPGGTAGTQGAKQLPAATRFFVERIFMPIAVPLGLAYTLEAGSRRIVDALFDTGLKSGEFYGAPEGKTAGPLVAQSTFYRDLADTVLQDSAMTAIHRFTK